MVGDSVDLIYRKSSFRGNEFALTGGISGHYQTGGKTGITQDFAVYYASGDLTWGGSGWSMTANGVWTGVDPRGFEEDEFRWSAGFLSSHHLVTAATEALFIGALLLLLHRAGRQRCGKMAAG